MAEIEFTVEHEGDHGASKSEVAKAAKEAGITGDYTVTKSVNESGVKTVFTVETAEPEKPEGKPEKKA